MKYLELTLPTPEENLACDEALLLACDEGETDEVLRFWEAPGHFAVLGYSGRIDKEVSLARCRERRVPVLRRLSGGGAVLQGPGCFNYSLVLQMREHAGLHDVTATNAFVMQKLKQALELVVPSAVAVQGHTDLTLGGKKFSGNAQYRKRRALLFHGSFLLDFDVSLITELLLPPPKQPAYRRNRSHVDFLTNLNLPASAIKAAVMQSCGAEEELLDVPFERIAMLVRDRYSKDEWNLKS